MMPSFISRLIARLDLDDRLQMHNIKRYALQCSLAAGVVLILLLVLDTAPAE